MPEWGWRAVVFFLAIRHWRIVAIIIVLALIALGVFIGKAF